MHVRRAAKISYSWKYWIQSDHGFVRVTYRAWRLWENWIQLRTFFSVFLTRSPVTRQMSRDMTVTLFLDVRWLWKLSCELVTDRKPQSEIGYMKTSPVSMCMVRWPTYQQFMTIDDDWEGRRPRDTAKEYRLQLHALSPDGRTSCWFSPLGTLAGRAIYFANVFVSIFNGQLSRPVAQNLTDQSSPKFQDW